MHLIQSSYKSDIEMHLLISLVTISNKLHLNIFVVLVIIIWCRNTWSHVQYCNLICIPRSYNFLVWNLQLTWDESTNKHNVFSKAAFRLNCQAYFPQVTSLFISLWLNTSEKKDLSVNVSLTFLWSTAWKGFCDVSKVWYLMPFLHIPCIIGL